MSLKGVLMKMKRLRTNGGCTDTQRRHHQLMLVFLLCLLVLSVGMTAAAKETLNQTNPDAAERALRFTEGARNEEKSAFYKFEAFCGDC